MSGVDRGAVISGVGISAVGRPAGKSALALTVDAALAAIGDAGLHRDDIDGLSTYPGLTADPPGASPVGVSALSEALRLRLNWFCGAAEIPGQLGAVINAIAAVQAGLARHVLCYRTVYEHSSSTSQRHGAVGPTMLKQFEWQLPFHAYSAANWVALQAEAYRHRYGVGREALAEIAVTERAHAALNPHAVYRAPLSVEDYFAARMISTPFGLYDCDVPVDGSVALVVSAEETAGDLRVPPVRIEAIGSALTGRDTWDQRSDLAEMGAHDAGRMLWQRTDLRPGDVDVAEVYDGFSFHVLAWLEALGFAEPGGAGELVKDGGIALGSRMPVNTNGGQLSGGRLHGFATVWEACLQLRGEAGARQVADAEVAVAAAGGGPLGSCLLLTGS